MLSHPNLTKGPFRPASESLEPEVSPSPLKPRTLGAGEGLSPRYKTWALSIVSTFFDSPAAYELCPCRCLGSKWKPGLMTLGLLGSLMISCSGHQSKVGVGGGASGNFRLQHLQSRLGPGRSQHLPKRRLD